MKETTYRENYLTNGRNIQLIIDEIFAEKVIPANDSVRLLDQIVEEMNLSPLYRAYERTGRKPATSPSTMLKIMLYANMQGIYSSRKIESSCRRDINFMWLLNGEDVPDHCQISRFRGKRIAECCEALFYELVVKLKEIGEIRLEHLFVDGTKIEANANKYSFVWKKSTNKYEARALAKLESLRERLCADYVLPPLSVDELLLILNGRMNIPFVHGRGKRKTQLQRDIEELSELIARRDKYAAYQQIMGNRNSFSKTDPDATFMHMKEDHMRNAQLKPGYNIQLAVEGEYITGVDVSSERSDQLTLIGLLENMREHLGEYYTDVTADAGYESEENYTWFEGKPCECYIKPQNYERSKTKKYKSNMALRENMQYDEQRDEYTCQYGRKLRAMYVRKRKSKSGFESSVTYYECEDCSDCPHRKSCTRSKGNRKLQVSKRFIKQREESLARITSRKGILLRMNRSIQSEGTFGVIKQDHSFRQFLLRGTKRVSTEIFLLAMGLNINKYHHKIQRNRTGSQLFGKLTV